ncbi:MAG: hypothetical protein HRT56_06510, partial [Coraliomargarita sp.]|nr:hypothetical protein [Coraliomargarita sp.]
MVPTNHFSRGSLCLFIGVAFEFLCLHVRAEQIPVLKDSVSVPAVFNVHYSSFDECVYYTTRPGSSSGATYRLEADNTSTLLYSGSTPPSGLTVDPNDGDVFISEDHPGNVRRILNNGSAHSVWVSGFGSVEDDDPAGLLIVPDYFTGTIASPGDAFVADRGWGESEQLFSFSKDSAEGEVELLAFERQEGLFDIVAADDVIVLVEYGQGLQLLVESNGTYSLQLVPMTPSLTQVSAACWDNLRKRMYLAATDPSTGSNIVAVFDPYSGTASTLLTGFSSLGWGSLSISTDFSELYVADHGAGELRSYILPYPSSFSTEPHAHGANTGWIHFAPSDLNGVVVHESYLSGYAHCANTGWMKFGEGSPLNGYRFT